MQKDTFGHTTAWLLMHPLWGFGFFVLVNRFVHAEKSWSGAVNKPRLLAACAAIGVFSYSLYLTHELVIMQSWWFIFPSLPPMVNALFVVTPATIGFAWLFYLFCEKPYMRKAVPSSEFQVSSSGFAIPSSQPAAPSADPGFAISNSEFGVAGLTLEPGAEQWASKS
jgi:peptidoglycan/LPS O-acetylase OafA/YrhL